MVLTLTWFPVPDIWWWIKRLFRLLFFLPSISHNCASNNYKKKEDIRMDIWIAVLSRNNSSWYLHDFTSVYVKLNSSFVCPHVIEVYRTCWILTLSTKQCLMEHTINKYMLSVSMVWCENQPMTYRLGVCEDKKKKRSEIRSKRDKWKGQVWYQHNCNCSI